MCLDNHARTHAPWQLPHACLADCRVHSLNLISCDIRSDRIRSDIMRYQIESDQVWYHMISYRTRSDLISPIRSDIMWYQMYRMIWCHVVSDRYEIRSNGSNCTSYIIWYQMISDQIVTNLNVMSHWIQSNLLPRNITSDSIYLIRYDIRSS